MIILPLPISRMVCQLITEVSNTSQTKEINLSNSPNMIDKTIIAILRDFSGRIHESGLKWLQTMDMANSFKVEYWFNQIHVRNIVQIRHDCLYCYVF